MDVFDEQHDVVARARLLDPVPELRQLRLAAGRRSERNRICPQRAQRISDRRVGLVTENADSADPQAPARPPPSDLRKDCSSRVFPTPCVSGQTRRVRASRGRVRPPAGARRARAVLRPALPASGSRERGSASHRPISWRPPLTPAEFRAVFRHTRLAVPPDTMAQRRSYERSEDRALFYDGRSVRMRLGSPFGGGVEPGVPLAAPNLAATNAGASQSVYWTLYASCSFPQIQFAVIPMSVNRRQRILLQHAERPRLYERSRRRLVGASLGADLRKGWRQSGERRRVQAAAHGYVASVTHLRTFRQRWTKRSRISTHPEIFGLPRRAIPAS